MAGFDISAATLAVWMGAGLTPATDVQIAQIRDMAGVTLPADYVSFLSTYGFASWGEGTDARFVSDLGGGHVSGLLSPENITFARGVTPDGYLPVASEYGGHDLVLMELVPNVGQIWHLNDSDELAQIADTFSAFVEGLTPDAAPAATEKWFGTRVEDPETGFVIAEETRAAWATYYTGSTPEPEGELKAIEATLGRPLPEALRTFLTTYGYVSYFGDAIATFDLPAGAGQAQDFISVIYSTAVLPRALPLADGGPLPFASTALKDGELLIGVTPDDAGQIFWRRTKSGVPVQVADDLRSFLASMYQERAADE